MTDTPSPDHIQEVLARQLGELAGIADRLRAAMLSGESPESLGLVEDGLAAVLQQRGITSEPRGHHPRRGRGASEADLGSWGGSARR